MGLMEAQWMRNMYVGQGAKVVDTNTKQWFYCVLSVFLHVYISYSSNYVELPTKQIEWIRFQLAWLATIFLVRRENERLADGSAHLN